MLSDPGALTAIIGAGLMGRWHARAARRAGARPSLVIDPDIAAASNLAGDFEGCAAAATIGSLEASGISVAHVCTPPQTHSAVVLEILDRGVHAIVEKPLASNAAETAQVLSRAVGNRVLVCPVHQLPFQRGTQQALAMLRGIGPVIHFDYVLCTAGADAGEDRDALAANVLAHPLSLAALFLPEPISVLAWRSVRAAPGELRATAQAGSATASIVVSTRARPTTNSATILCERGSLHLDLFHGYCVVEGRRVSRSSKIARPFVRSTATLAAAAQNLARRALRREPAFPGLFELVDRFYESVRAGGLSPISREETLDIAVARDRILAGLSAGSSWEVR